MDSWYKDQYMEKHFFLYEVIFENRDVWHNESRL